MLDTYAFHYYEIGKFITVNLQKFPHDVLFSLRVDDELNLKDNLDIILGHCEAIRLHDSATHIRKVLANDRFDHNSVRHLLLELDKSLSKELSIARFIHVPQDKVTFYDNHQLFQYVVAKFPSAALDIREAGTCFALARPTACVFHLMRVLEKGLHAFAGSLGVSFPAAIELENWAKIIDKIEGEIRKLQNQPKSNQKSADLQFSSEAATEFRYFKDAWRNHVAHSRTAYTDPEAQKIMQHVAEFMQHLAKRLGERDINRPAPKPEPSIVERGKS